MYELRICGLFTTGAELVIGPFPTYRAASCYAGWYFEANSSGPHYITPLT
jgi:hypothetical protein